MLFIALTIIFFIVLVLTVGIDLLYYYYKVFQRIHIGRWSDLKTWYTVICKQNQNYFKEKPTVKLTDNDRYIILDLLKGHYRNSTIQSWQEAGTLYGALSSNVPPDTVKEFIESKIDPDTRKWKQVPSHVDGALLAYTIAKSVEDKESLKPAFDEIIQLIENCEGSEGTIFYRDFIPDIRFVDTIGFICPFLTFYAQTFDAPKYKKLAMEQIRSYMGFGFLNGQNIPVHAYDLKKEMPLGVYGWGRGLGWFIIGVVEMYNELHDNSPEKKELETIILKTANDTLPYQKQDGGFNAMMGVESSRHDSSITCLAGLLFHSAYTISKEEKFISAAKNCIASLMKSTRRNGEIDFCQGDTKGIGLYAKTFDIMPFVQGLTIRLAKEIHKEIL